MGDATGFGVAVATDEGTCVCFGVAVAAGPDVTVGVGLRVAVGERVDRDSGVADASLTKSTTAGTISPPSERSASGSVPTPILADP